MPYKEGKLHGKEVQFFDINRKKISTPSYKNGSENYYKFRDSMWISIIFLKKK